jgi:glycosyltransferase involved in cell wall biosynthesis
VKADNISMPPIIQNDTAERIRVLFVLGSLQAGGSERQVLQILKLLDRSRFQPLLYVVYRAGHLLTELPADVPLFSFADHFTESRLRLPGWISLRQALDLARTLRRERVDVVCDRNFDMSLLSMAASWRRFTPRVCVVSSDPTRDVPARAGRFLTLKKRLVRLAYQQAHRVVAVSAGVRATVCDFYQLPERQVVTIYNLFDLQRINSLATAFRPAMSSTQFHLVAVGRLQAEKGIRYLVDAVADVVHRRGRQQIALWIVGDGPEAGELRAQVQAAQLDKHVRFTGYQANPLPYIRCADLLCLPSLYEGMPNALAEAMACGTPVLATDCPSGPRELLHDGECGTLVPPADVRALADAIEDAVLRPAAWRVRTSLARQRLERNFAADVGIARYQALLAEACGGQIAGA